MGIGTTASGTVSMAIGDETTASGFSSLATGFMTTASGSISTAMGWHSIASADHSTAIGYYAVAEHLGSFVWTDSTDASFNSTSENEFSARATGGVRFITNSNGTSGVFIVPGGSSWSTVSDRKAKENFEPVDTREVLEALSEVPVETWNYKSQDETIRHMGPMAQDFHLAFGLGTDDKTINTVDADGVALAAVQGLHELVKEQQALLWEQQSEIDRLKEILCELKPDSEICP